MTDTDYSYRLKCISRKLSRACGKLRFDSAAMVYNPLEYAERPHNQYLNIAGRGPKEVIFLGMNPGPWGMVQTGVPFGDAHMVQDYLGIHATISKPKNQHPNRPIEGYQCRRFEVSGRRFWGFISKYFYFPHEFFRYHFVANYCPLAFMDSNGANITPDKLPKAESRPLFDVCDHALFETIKLLRPKWVIGIGSFAKKRIDAMQERFFTGEFYEKAENAADNDRNIKRFSTAQIMHPSPANPGANAGWENEVLKTLTELGIWQK